jgi:hypothetical protein
MTIAVADATVVTTSNAFVGGGPRDGYQASTQCGVRSHLQLEASAQQRGGFLQA